MFKLLKKQEPEKQEPKQEQESQITVPVRDIKQYLVDEYERAKLLNEKLEEQEDALEKAKEVELKYQATLVTLDEFDRRIKSKDSEIGKLRDRIVSKEEQIRTISDDLNSHKILLNQAGITKEEIAREVKAEFATELIGEVESLKGNLAKKQVVGIIENLTAESHSSKEVEGEIK